MQLKLISIVGLAWGLTSCSSPAPIPATANPQPPAALSSPVRIYVAIDRTASVGASKIPTLKLDNLQPLIELVKKVGGEIRVAEVCTSSDLRLNSFYLPEPPLAPQPPTAPKPGAVNPLELPKLQKQFDLQARAYQQQLTAYDRVMALRQQEAQRNSTEFTTKISKVLEQPPNCQASDLVGMVERGDLYLSEAGNWRHVFGGEPVIAAKTRWFARREERKLATERLNSYRALRKAVGRTKSTTSYYAQAATTNQMTTYVFGLTESATSIIRFVDREYYSLHPLDRPFDYRFGKYRRQSSDRLPGL